MNEEDKALQTLEQMVAKLALTRLDGRKMLWCYAAIAILRFAILTWHYQHGVTYARELNEPTRSPKKAFWRCCEQRPGRRTQ